MPDYLGAHARAARAITHATTLTGMLVNLDYEQRQTGKFDEDVCSGQSGRTFAQERARLRAELAALEDETADIRETIDELLADRERAAGDEAYRRSRLTRDERIAETYRDHQPHPSNRAVFESEGYRGPGRPRRPKRSKR